MAILRSTDDLGGGFGGSVGAGLWLALVASIVLVAAGFLLLRLNPA